MLDIPISPGYSKIHIDLHPMHPYSAAAKAAGFLACGIISKIVFPPFGPPFFSVAGCLFITRLAVKILERYDYKSMEVIQVKLKDFQRRYPLAQMIALLFALAISCLSITAGCIAGSFFGIYAGFLIGADQCKELQRVKRITMNSQTKLNRTQIVLT